MGGIYVGNDFHRLMVRAEVRNSPLVGGGGVGVKRQWRMHGSWSGKRKKKKKEQKEQKQKKSLERRNLKARLSVPTAEEVIN